MTQAQPNLPFDPEKLPEDFPPHRSIEGIDETTGSPRAASHARVRDLKAAHSGATRATARGAAEAGKGEGRHGVRAGSPSRITAPIPFEVDPYRKLWLPPALFDLRESLGRGETAPPELHRALQRSLDRDVAAWRIAPDYRRTEDALEEARDILREAVVMAELDHPNIPPVYGASVATDGSLLIGTRLFEETSWADHLAAEKGNPDKVDDALPIFLDVCNALIYAHSRQIAHRDVKPANVLLGRFEEVYLIGWGLAVDCSDRDERAPEENGRHYGRRTKATPRRTAINPSGTPSYMAPEQLEASAAGIGPWTDIYQMGGILYEILTGTPPHRGRTLREVFASVGAARIESPEQCAAEAFVPQRLAEICMKALAPRPADRFASIKELHQAVEDYMTGADGRRKSVEMMTGLHADVVRSNDYSRLNEVETLVHRALDCWPDNPAARKLQFNLRRRKAELAIARGDFALAQNILEIMQGEGDAFIIDALRGDLEAGRHQRSADEGRRGLWRTGTLAVAVLALAGFLYLLYGAIAQRDEADHARLEADAARDRSLLALHSLVHHVAGSLEESAPGSETARVILAETGTLYDRTLRQIPELAGDGSRRAEALLALGRAFARAGDHEAALQRFQAAIGLMVRALADDARNTSATQILLRGRVAVAQSLAAAPRFGDVGRELGAAVDDTLSAARRVGVATVAREIELVQELVRAALPSLPPGDARDQLIDRLVALTELPARANEPHAIAARVFGRDIRARHLRLGSEADRRRALELTRENLADVARLDDMATTDTGRLPDVPDRTRLATFAEELELSLAPPAAPAPAQP